MRRELRTPRVNSLKFVNYTIIENAHKVRKKIFNFYVTVICTTTRGQNRYGLVCVVITNPPELPINEEARNEAHIKAQVCDGISTQNETGNYCDTS